MSLDSGNCKSFEYGDLKGSNRNLVTLTPLEICREDKKELERLFRYIFRILGFPNRFLGIRNLDINLHSAEIENSKSELIFRLPLADDKEDSTQCKSKVNISKESDFFLELKKDNLSNSEYQFIKKLYHAVEMNYQDQDFNVEQLAKLLQLSQPTLYRKVRELTGKNACDFIRSFRLHKGVQLLKKNFGQVIDVAFEVGFNSRIYFTKCFKEKFNKTPSQFLEELTLCK